MKQTSQIIQKVDAIYQWLETELASLNPSCTACGKCCDFESFGHRLYLTTPELLYFQHHVGPDIQPMTTGVCPYRVDGQCRVYPCRFASCRIFTCKGDTDTEHRICEETIRAFKDLCDQYRLDYQYVSLQAGLAMLRQGTFQLTTPTFNQERIQ